MRTSSLPSRAGWTLGRDRTRGRVAVRLWAVRRSAWMAAFHDATGSNGSLADIVGFGRGR